MSCKQENHFTDLYKQAVKTQDVTTAVVALNGLLAQNSASIYTDTLAQLYFNTNAPTSCLSIIEPLLVKGDTTQQRLEWAAYSYQAIGKNLEALDCFNRMISDTPHVSHLYEIAYLQFIGKGYEPFTQTVQKFYAQPIDTLNTPVVLVRAEQLSQPVNVYAAMLHLEALYLVHAQEKERAIATYEQCLKIQPNFTLAKQNLQALLAVNSKE